MLSDETSAYLRELVRRKCAVVLDESKRYLLDARLLPLAKAEGLEDLEGLATKLRADEDGPLAVRTMEAMTTNETSFFRDGAPFVALRTHVLPRLIAARAEHKRLRIWCAAASTGQEPYGIALTIAEHFPALVDWRIEILATDINATVLAQAREGVFSQHQIGRGLPSQLLMKWFEREESSWRIAPRLRAMVETKALNLCEPWSWAEPFDVIFARNVLIYFDTAMKCRVLEQLRPALRDDGFLVLGAAETTLNLTSAFVSSTAAGATLYQPALRGPGL